MAILNERAVSDIYKKGNDIVPMSFYFVNFAFGEGSLSPIFDGK